MNGDTPTVQEAQEALAAAVRTYAEAMDSQDQDGDAVLAGAVLVYEMAHIDTDGEPGHGPGYVLLEGTPLQALGSLVYGRRMLESTLDAEDDE